MKKLFLGFFIFPLWINLSAQDWQPIAPNITAQYVYDMEIFQGDLYLGGVLYNLDNKSISGLARWDGQKWHPVGRGANTVSTLPGDRAAVATMVSYKGELIVAGAFDSVDNIIAKNIATYNGTTWNRVGNSLGADRFVGQVSVFENELYACGIFQWIGGVYAPGIAKWDGTNWSRIGLKHFSSTQAFIPYQGDIYIIATEIDSTIPGPFPAILNGIYRWNGNKWNPIPDVPASNNSARNFFGREIYGGKLLYASLHEANPPNNRPFRAVQWDGNSWSEFDNTLKEDVCAMTIFRNEIYLGHDGIKLNGPIIQRWDGHILVRSWKDVGTLAGGKPRSFIEYNNQLYVCGEFPGGVVYRYGFPTSIEDAKEGPSFSIIPNPVVQQAHLVFENTEPMGNIEVRIFDCKGTLIHKMDHVSSTRLIDTRSLSPGVYVVQATSKGSIVGTQKMVVK